MAFVTCPCGTRAEHGCSPGSSVGDIASATGFKPCFNQRDGLTTVYVCPACQSKVREAMALLRSVFGDQTKYIHMVHLERF